MTDVRPITLDEIRAARTRIAGTIIRTPLVKLELGPGFPDIRLKLENLQTEWNASARYNYFDDEANASFAVSELAARAGDFPFELALTLEASAMINGASSLEASIILEDLGVVRTSTPELLGHTDRI